MQLLNLCLSHKGTMNIIENISQDHDIDVQMWCDELVPLIKKPVLDVSWYTITIGCCDVRVHNYVIIVSTLNFQVGSGI